LDLDSDKYIIVYAVISVVVGILIYLKGYFFGNFIVSSSRVIQKKLIQTLLKTPLNWFDVTPTGRIISRTTKDQDDLDSNLSFNVQFSVQNLLILISMIVYYKLISLYMNSSR
jgi:ABC-type multidrug transport system fused ATPase/permease subunit